MKKVLFVLAALALGASANACPDLAGAYNCTLNGEDYPVDVAQRVTGGATEYSITIEGISKDFIADGKNRTLPDDELAANQKYKAVCSSKGMTADIQADILGGDGSKAGDLDSTIAIQKTGSRSATVTVKGIANFDGQKNKFNDTIQCVK